MIPPRRCPRAALVLAALVLAAGCTTAPVADTGGALVEIGDALNALRQEDALLQAQVDSLRLVVARQDTLITRLEAALATIPR